jgi:integrase
MALDWKKTSQWWYGKLSVNGRTKLVNLGVKITGDRPAHINAADSGVDARFIESRGKALQEHDKIRDQIRSRSNLEEVHQKILELKTGGRVEFKKLAEIPDAWLQIERKREPGVAHKKACRAILHRFVMFMSVRFPVVADLASVSRTHMAAFMDSEKERLSAPRTWNVTLTVLRTVFRHYQPEADAYRHYLLTTPSREEETIHRIPFSPDELRAIMETTKGDDFIRPLLVTGMCTAMRRGDVCLLKWASVDLKSGFITVKTAKSKGTVAIPIFPLLKEELQKWKGKGSQYVFPEQAAMYLKNPDGISRRVKQVLMAALMPPTPKRLSRPELSQDTIRQKGCTYIETLGGTSKALRMKAAFDAYMDGTRNRDILATHQISKATLSGYLNEIESKIGCPVIRGHRYGRTMAALVKVDDSLLSIRQSARHRRISVRDFHSLRVTWVTLALTANVPLEIVRKVTGHKTIEIVLTNYFQPGREAYRQTLQTAMPQLMMNGGATRDDQLREIILRMTPMTILRDKIEALALLNGSA